MFNWIVGKRTYIIAGLIIVGALLILLTSLTFSDVPDFVWLLLNGLGLATIRAGINEVSKNDNQGYKSYVAAIAITVLGILKMLGIEFPVEILAALEGFGVIGIRQALSKIK